MNLKSRAKDLAANLTARILHTRGIGRIYSSVFLSPPKYIDAAFAGIPLRISIPNSYVREYILSGPSENENVTIEFLKNNCKNGDIFYDVGANIGLYVLLLSRIHDFSQIAAFEPEALNFSELCRNIQMNKYTNVLALPIALGSHDGFAEFRLQEFKIGNASGAMKDYALPSDVSQDGLYIEGYSQTVPVRRLDTLRKDLDLSAPNVCLIDIDGGEIQVLLGMAETLSDPGLRHIVVELSDETEVECRQLLESKGFSLVRGRSQRRGNEFFSRV